MRTMLLAMGFSMMVGCGSPEPLERVEVQHDGVFFCVMNCCEDKQLRVIPCPPKDVISVPITPLRMSPEEERFNALMEDELAAERAKISENK